MRAMMFDVVKLRSDAALRSVKHARQFRLEIAYLRRVAKPILDLVDQAGALFRGARGGEQHLLVKMRRRISRDSDVVQVIETNPRGCETVANRLLGEAGAVFEPIEAFLLDGGNQFAVANNGRRRVAVIRVDAENVRRHLLIQYSDNINSAVPRWKA